MTRLHASYTNGILTLQPKEYIDDGWFIEHQGIKWRVLEVPEGGGNAQKVESFESFGDAYIRAINLT